MKIKCIIIDDEHLAREGIADYIGKTVFLKLDAEFKNVAEARDFIEQHPIDLIFLDINMPGENGLEFFKSLNDPPFVIFTTAYREFAAESYELDAVDYLVKPIAFERFLKAVNKVYTRLEQNQVQSSDDDCFFVKVDGVITKVLVEDILYVEGMKDYVKIHRQDKTSALRWAPFQKPMALPQSWCRRAAICAMRWATIWSRPWRVTKGPERDYTLKRKWKTSPSLAT